MLSISRVIVLFCLLLLPALAFAAEPKPRSFTIEGVKREALLCIPDSAKSQPAPVVFAFHGHGGNMNNSARSFHIHTLWPEAIVVYMQGLNTPGRLTDPEGKKPGWQSNIGAMGDRDLKFFDALLAALRSEYKVDDKRIYSTGHSNGGGFTYLLWAARGEVFAAMAPSAAAGARNDVTRLKPKPALHVAGTNDLLVKYEWQEAAMKAIRKLNGCSEEGKSWKSAGELKGTIYESTGGTPFISLISPGTHAYPKEAPGLIVEFFKQYSKP